LRSTWPCIKGFQAENNIGNPKKLLAEYRQLLTEVDQPMHICDELETRLNQSKKDSEMLMQALLYEAFS
jgi:type I restriction enzyme S subunit